VHLLSLSFIFCFVVISVLSKGWPRLNIHHNAWDRGRGTFGLHVLYVKQLPAPASQSNDAASIVANNFWGKDDAGLQPMLDRMHGSKTTSDELKAFYSGT
jgi:hypothetical protein